MKTLRAVALGLALVLVTAACRGQVGSPAVSGPEVEAFDPSLLLDVLGPDAIRSIDAPKFESAARVAWLSDDSPVLAVEVDGDARAYPLGILTRHEIVNDRIAGRKVAVTFCPLCNSGVVYDRVATRDGAAVGGLEFGVSGKLYQSDLVMYDRRTKSLWPQIMGVAVLGPLKGARLTPIPSGIVDFAQFRTDHGEGRVLARPDDTPYNFNPYPGYDSRTEPYPDFYDERTDQRVGSMRRVVGVAVGDHARAYPYPALAAKGDPAAVNDRLGGKEIVVFWGGGARSALDAGAIDAGRKVGGSGVFDANSGGRPLRFTVRRGAIVDVQTGSEWSLLGRARSGPLKGTQLAALHHLDAFWFAWSSFVPHTTVWPDDPR